MEDVRTEILRDGRCADTLTDAEIPPERCALPTDAPGELPAEEPMFGGPGMGRRMSGNSDVRFMPADLRTPAVDTREQPNANPHFYSDMSYKELHTLRKQRGYLDRDATSPVITRLPAMDQIDRYRALDDPETESSAAKKRALLAVLLSAFAANGYVVMQHRQWRVSVMEGSWGALPSTPVDGVDAASSAWAADLRGATLDKEPSQEHEQKYAPSVWAAQGRELVAWKE